MSAEVVDGVPSMTGLSQVSQSPKGRLSAPLNPNAQALSSREIRFSWFPPPGKPLGYKVRSEWIPGEGVGPILRVFHTRSHLCQTDGEMKPKGGSKLTLSGPLRP